MQIFRTDIGGSFTGPELTPLSALSMQSHCLVSLPSFSELLLSIGSPGHRPFSPPSDPPSVHTSHIKRIARGRHKEQKNVCSRGDRNGREMTISMLPDDVLLEIFDFYKDCDDYEFAWNWDILVHVCGRWRHVVFASPLRLDLRILCTFRTPVRENLDIWPALPIVMDYSRRKITTDDEDNIFSALEHVDRVCDVRLRATGSELEKFTTAMQDPFPVLSNLLIESEDVNTPVLPADFLGGSAPCLQSIFLERIPFPALPTLLLSTSDLVALQLHDIPPSGYISPEAMVVGQAALPRLRAFTIRFRLATPGPDLTHPPPATRTVLPALNYFRYEGASEYLEDLVARIDGPQLNWIDIYYLNQLVDFQVAQLSKFIDRSVGPKLTLSRYAQIVFHSDAVSFDTYRHANDVYLPLARTTIICQGIDWQVSCITQLLNQFPATLSRVVHLRLDADIHHELECTDEIEWLDLLRQFSPVKTLCVDDKLAGKIAFTLNGITEEMIADVLPSLDLIFLQASSIEGFIVTRQLSGRPVTVVDIRTEFDERLKSYFTD